MDRRSSGFTLLEIVIVLGVIAVLAGVVGPAVVKQIDDSKIEAAEEELDGIETALRMYHRDCKTLPTEASGLEALVTNVDGVAGWRGPYVGGRGDQVTAVQTDPWGHDYLYVPGAKVRGYSYLIDFLLVSGGLDQVLDTKKQGQRWRANDTKDLVRLGALTETNAEWARETQQRLRDLEDGFTRYYSDVGRFPSGQDDTAIGELLTSTESGWAGPYIAGLATDVSKDSWGRTVTVRSCTRVNGENVTGWILLSDGPGEPSARVNGGGKRWRTAENDVYLVIRESTLDVALGRDRREAAKREIRVLAGEIYASNPSASPSSFTLPEADPWGNAFEYDKASTYSGTLYSRGPDGADDGGGGDDEAETLLWHP